MSDQQIINPFEDGTFHINIYSKGKTELGRLLSNFAHTPFICSKHGRFASVEGFWYWYFTGKQHSVLKELYGYNAKSVGRSYIDDNYEISESDKLAIKYAITLKISQNTYLENMLLSSTLPLLHYYVYNDVAVVPEKYNWITEFIDNYRIIRKYS